MTKEHYKKLGGNPTYAKTMETNEIELIVNELDNDFTEVLIQMEAEDDNK